MNRILLVLYGLLVPMNLWNVHAAAADTEATRAVLYGLAAVAFAVCFVVRLARMVEEA